MKKYFRFILSSVCVIMTIMIIPAGCTHTSTKTTDADPSAAASNESRQDTADSGDSDSSTAVSSDDETASVSADSQIIEEGSSLIIPTNEISDTAQFYSVEVDGTQMEIIAVKDSDGNIRTAFNTCQICYSSGRGYYVQDGNYLVCQNCGNRFTVDQVEIESGGCNPWPIFEEDKTVTEDSVEISYDFLKESKEIFSNWKTSF